MAQNTNHVRFEQYSENGVLQICEVGTLDRYKPPHDKASGFKPTNVVRPTFNPGTISVIQQAAEPSYDGNPPVLGSDLYMWKAIFRVADLYDIRVRESNVGALEDPQIRIELRAICKTPPIGHGLVAKAGTRIEEIFNVADDTSEPVASSVAIANISNRWASGEQEIKLDFTRTTQIERNPGPSNVQSKKQPVRGGEVWVWNAFLAFLCGVGWTTPQEFAFVAHAQMPLDRIVNSEFPNPFAEFEKKDDGWVLIKIKPNAQPRSSVSVPHRTVSHEENKSPDKRLERFADSVAGPSTASLTFPARPPPTAGSSNPPHLDADLSLPVLGAKRKATDEAEEDGRGKRVESENLSQLTRDRYRALCRFEMSKEEERRWREKKEEELETARRLQLQMDIARR